MRASRLLGGGFALFLGLISFVGCSKPEVEKPMRCLLVAVDGADWDSAIPLIHQGKMPTLKRLIELGPRRTMLSLDPPKLSPAIWTSVATGVNPDRHGIGHFVTQVEGKLAPMTSNQRKVAALWNIASVRGLEVGVLGWLTTWPAEPVQGYMVSSYTPYAFDWDASRPIKGTVVPGLPDQMYPDGLQDRLDPLKVAPNSFSTEELSHRFTEDPIPAKPPKDAGESITGMRWSWAADQTYERIYHQLAENPVGETRPDLEMLYFSTVDVVSHRFWKYKEPSSWIAPVAEADVATFGPTIENAYVAVDDIVAGVLEREEEAVNLVLLSDHGFRENTEPKRKTSSGWHRREGLMLAAGPAFVEASILEAAHVVDVAPTVLYALGLPVADDMDGDVIEDLFLDDLLETREIESVASYEPEVRRSRESAPKSSSVDGDILEVLRGLGYIE